MLLEWQKLPLFCKLCITTQCDEFHNLAGNQTDVFQRKRHKIGVRFIKQVICQNTLFLFQEFSYFCTCPFFESQWAVFFSSTFVWEMTPALDGLIVVLFHFRFSHFGGRFMKKKPPAVVAMFSHRKTKRQAKILCERVQVAPN
ncbi:hypothetical protein KIN20_010868 [Parelaphostrongylus tenuis]|uniref:7TM GPCR serpentine receptor class x (Srx) domain-containing protein n=1 Tax=Parelaphostrongylus tenuis TaxID=148309 RepID=A0AAD5MZL2_PARTN|nr:hypothetical protein KIN20_010868 [Parelaphostrongylus tenuis]